MGTSNISQFARLLWSALALSAIGCAVEVDGSEDMWPEDALTENDIRQEELRGTCNGPDVPVVALSSPAAGTQLERGAIFQAFADVKTCRSFTAFVEVTEPALPTDKKPRVHTYGLQKIRDMEFSRKTGQLRIPKKARIGTYRLRVIVKSVRVEAAVAEASATAASTGGAPKTIKIKEQTSTDSIAFQINELPDDGTQDSDGGTPIPACTNGQTRACGTAVGLCVGTETCAGGVWQACDAPLAVTEKCGNGLDDDCDGSADEGCGGGGNPTSCAASLASRLSVVRAPISGKPDLYSVDGAAWGTSGGTAISWSAGNKVHVTRLDAQGKTVGADFIAPGKARGMAASGNTFGVLAAIPFDYSKDKLQAVVFDAQTGAIRANPMLSLPNEYLYGDNLVRVVANDPISKRAGYVAYYAIDNGKHWADQIATFQADGQVGYNVGWGCSHSFGVAIQTNAVTTGSVCLSDGYPCRGLVYDGAYATGECATMPNVITSYQGARPGSLAAVSDGFWLSYTAAPVAGSVGNIFLIKSNNDGIPQKPGVSLPFVTSSSFITHVVAFDGGLLLHYSNAFEGYLVPLDNRGKQIGDPVVLTGEASQAFLYVDDFFRYPNGDVGLAGANASTSDVYLARVQKCQ